MKVVIQRVKEASVIVEGRTVAEIGKGVLVFLGITHSDKEKNAEWTADKVVNLRIFEDDAGKMNLSVIDIKGQILVVSQFTLYGETEKGRRPSFTNAAKPEYANKLYRYFIQKLQEYPIIVKEGIFQARMEINLVNAGPVTFIIEK